MNRNMKLGIAVLMVALFVGLTYGAVVTYLSNKVTADITVTSPMKVGISLGRDSWATTECWRADPGEWVLSFPEGYGHGGEIHDWLEADWVDSITFEDIHGGETITLYVRSVNLADALITGFEEAIVTNGAGVTSADFVSVEVCVDSIYGDLGYGTEHDLIALGAEGYEELDNYHIRFGTEDLSTWDAGETDVTKMVVTFEEAAFGTYTFTYQIVPEAPIP